MAAIVLWHFIFLGLVWPFNGLLGLLLTIIVLFLLYRWVKKKSLVTEKDINRDLKRFRAELDDMQKKLAAWSDQDLELLSTSLMERKKKRGRHPIEKGIINNIYNEPTLAYICKHYTGKPARTLLIIRTVSFEMVWLRNEDGITIYKNGTLMGNLLRDGRYFNADGKRLLGQLKQDHKNDISLYINDQLSAMVLKSVEQNRMQNKAIELFEQDMGDKKDIIFAMAMLDVMDILRK